MIRRSLCIHHLSLMVTMRIDICHVCGHRHWYVRGDSPMLDPRPNYWGRDMKMHGMHSKEGKKLNIHAASSPAGSPVQWHCRAGLPTAPLRQRSARHMRRRGARRFRRPRSSFHVPQGLPMIRSSKLPNMVAETEQSTRATTTVNRPVIDPEVSRNLVIDSGQLPFKAIVGRWVWESAT